MVGFGDDIPLGEAMSLNRNKKSGVISCLIIIHGNGLT